MSAVCAACSGSTWHRDGCRFEDTISDGFGSVPRRVQLSRAKGWRPGEPLAQVCWCDTHVRYVRPRRTSGAQRCERCEKRAQRAA